MKRLNNICVLLRCIKLRYSKMSLIKESLPIYRCNKFLKDSKIFKLFEKSKNELRVNALRQVYANLIETSWHLVTQHATSVSASLIKIRINKLHPCFGSRGSEVQTLSPQPFKTMSYGLGRSPFFVWGGIWGGKWRANRIKFPQEVLPSDGVGGFYIN